MRSSRKPAAIIGLCCFLGIPLGAWLVYAAQDHEPKPEPTAVPAFWGDPAGADDALGSALMTHGGWFCANPDCRFLRLSGGQPFRSAKAQACSLCREPLVASRPVAAALPVTEPEGG